MTTQQDASLGIKKETVFGTVVVVDKFVEFVSEEFNWVPTFTQNAGMRMGKVVGASDRRVLTKEESTGALEVELVTKGLGALFEAALGAGTSTLVSGTAYQQVFTPTTTDYLPSYTVQVGVPTLGAGPAQPQTYAGMVCSGFELTAGNTALPTCTFNFVGKSMETSTALAAASYPAGNELYSFVNGAITLGGTVVLPTATALASGGTVAANVQEASISWDNGLDGNGFNLGSAGQRSRKPAMGLRVGTGSLTVEYDSNILRDAWRTQAALNLVLTFQTNTVISGAAKPTLQITIPDIRLNGEMPKPNGGDTITQSIAFDITDNRVAASPIYVAIVTAESAI